MDMIALNKLCKKGVSSLRQKDVENDGPYPVYGASGIVGYSADYQNEERYVAVIKDGAGVGRVCICEPKSSVLGTMQALLPAEGVNCDYLLHLVRSMKLGDGFTGSTIPHIYFKDYGKRIVVEHGSKEQRQIAESLYAVEAQAAALRAQSERLDELVKSRFVEMFGSGDYPTVPLANCVDSIDSGKSPKCNSASRSGGNPAVLKLSAISSGVYLESENKELLPGESIVQSKEVIAGDILLARKNTPELVGKSVYVSATEGNIMFPDIVFRMHPISSVNGIYLSCLLSGPLFDSIRALAHGSAKSMSNIPKTELAKLQIPVPPLDLQQEFAAFVQQVDKLKFETQQAVEKLQMLYDSLAQEYFGS